MTAEPLASPSPASACSGPLASRPPPRRPCATYYVLNEEPIEPLATPLFRGVLPRPNLNADEIYDKVQIIVRRAHTSSVHGHLGVGGEPYQMLSDIIASALQDPQTFERGHGELGDTRPTTRSRESSTQSRSTTAIDVWYAAPLLLAGTQPIRIRRAHVEATIRRAERCSLPGILEAVRALSELLQQAIKESISELEKIAVKDGSKVESPRNRQKRAKETSKDRSSSPRPATPKPLTSTATSLISKPAMARALARREGRARDRVRSELRL